MVQNRPWQNVTRVRIAFDLRDNFKIHAFKLSHEEFITEMNVISHVSSHGTDSRERSFIFR